MARDLDETQRLSDESKHPLVVEVRRRGSDACNIRDAAHEAHHALTANAKRWDRESIHEALMEKLPTWPERVSEEVLARCVEQLVCKDLGAVTWSIEKTASLMVMEHVSNYRLSLPFDAVKRYITTGVKSKRARDAADRVLALVGAPSQAANLAETRRYGAAELRAVIAAPKKATGKARGKLGRR